MTVVNQLLNTGWSIPAIPLPPGISFYTFTPIAYLVDTNRGKTLDTNPIAYSQFVTFFPHLISGPIPRDHELMPQFLNLKHFIFSHRNLALGLT
ncbi:hypothetical protein NDI44_03690 [Trichocoleus sp. DQ-A3]|nr:hypothetical protein [Coleofasciculus sp. FACHB-129]MBD1900819.1 hypothetical protein [Coleofasciculus sp. FACHB-125]